MNSFTVTAVGNLAKDPEPAVKGDTSYTKFCLVGNDYAGKDEQGNARETVNTLWFVAFEGLGETIAKNVRKGDQLILQRRFDPTTGRTRKARSSTTIHLSFRLSASAHRAGSSARNWRRGATRERERSKPKSKGNWIRVAPLGPRAHPRKRNSAVHHPRSSRFAVQHLLLPLLLTIMLTAAPDLAMAQASPFMTGATSLQTNLLAWLTPVAIILVMVLGGMAMANRMSWGWCLGAILGIAIGFGAPQIVTWVRGMFGV